MLMLPRAIERGSMYRDLPPAICHLVVFLLAEQQYALPLPMVERVLPMVAVSPLPQAPPMTLGVINLHGTVIPVLDLRRRFGFPPHEYGLAAHVLLTRTTRRTLALPVDEVLGVKEVAAIAVTSPEALVVGGAPVVGIVALADGLLCIHDLDNLLSYDEEQQLTRAIEEAAPCG
jgi:purine-binding chemotaxis protein CheW